MTRAWKILIAAGIISLVAIVLWEFYQVTSGGRTTFSLTVVEMGRSNLLSPGLEEHLETDPDFETFVSFPVSN